MTTSERRFSYQLHKLLIAKTNVKLMGHYVSSKPHVKPL